jgi:diaminopimelate decarboxylase
MHHFEWRSGLLHAEDVPIPEIARDVGTPFYCYASATIERHYRVFTESFPDLKHRLCFSVKANSNLAVLRTLARLGAGADVVSGGEIRRALMAGFKGGDIVFSGVGKTDVEIALALETGIYQFNVESEPELQRIGAIAAGKGLKAPVTIRVNPDVDAVTHAKITTGKAENKFGIPWSRAREIYGRAAALAGIRIVGVDVHIGSQLTDLEPFEAAFRRVADVVTSLRADGHNIERVDLGGGLGIPYGAPESGLPPLPSDYGRMVKKVLGNIGAELMFEPGRLIVGNAGILVSKVIYLKEGENRRFVIIDAAMNDLIRPSLYDAWHEIRPVVETSAALLPVDVVGPVCETGDTFARNRMLAPVKAGDLVAILSAGAYGAVMASSYNSRPLVPEVLVAGERFAVTRRRPSFEEMVALESFPDWLTQL